MKIRKSHLFGILALLTWSPVPWLYFGRLDFLAGHPLAIYAVGLFIGGLSFAVLGLYSFLKLKVPIKAARFFALVFLCMGMGAYQLSPFAPNWSCFSKGVYVSVANAAGQNCTTTCTWNTLKPCSGWSTCWDKFVSCNASGIDQDGRPCQGCCFACDVVCEPEEDPDQPPTITANVSCSRYGNNGWCTGNSSLHLTASDPQGYTLTISGNLGGAPFTCSPGKTCTVSLPQGNGTITYKVTASTSGLTASGSTTWKKDTEYPSATLTLPSATGSNGWFKTLPVSVSVNGSDATSGVDVAQLSLNSGATWYSSNISLSTDGVYIVHYGVTDVAGNRTDYSGQFVRIDTTPPVITNISVSGDVGSSGWYVGQVSVLVDAMDALPGIDTISISNGGGPTTANPVTLSDGIHNLSITATDKAGNRQSTSRTVSVDTIAPVISPALTGTVGENGWYVSDVTVNATALDATSGLQGMVEVSQDNGLTWFAVPIELGEGIQSLIFRAHDVAGNEGRVVVNAAIDATAPSLDFVFEGTPGENGWYVSEVAVSAGASDALSGLDSYEVRANGGTWVDIHKLSDGIHDLEARAADKAGNKNSIVGSLRVDTRPPGSIFISHANDDVVSGMVTLGGKSSDAMSGISLVEVSLDGGDSWQRADAANGSWSYAWDTSRLTNGTYDIQIRATDMAGNQEIPTSLTLIAANFPPDVKITDSWWIWESGSFRVSRNVFAIAEIKVTIRDPQNRWRPVVFPYNPHTTASEVTWDRRFGEALAPSGNYHATVLACDMYGNCASDQGVIRIPMIAPVPPSATPFADPTSLPTETLLPVVTKTPAQFQPTQTPQAVDIFEQERAIPSRKGLSKHSSWVIAFITLLTLFFGTTSILDPRPKALNSLAKTLDQFNTLTSIYDKE